MVVVFVLTLIILFFNTYNIYNSIINRRILDHRWKWVTKKDKPKFFYISLVLSLAAWVLLIILMLIMLSKFT
jgi:hypothetical protein